MPRGNGTGRNGAGPMYGRAMGYCAGYDMPGYVNGDGAGLGFGGGRFQGRGRGFCRTQRPGDFRMGRVAGYGYGAKPSTSGEDVQVEALMMHLQRLEHELAVVKSRLAVLKKDTVEQGEQI